MERLFIEATKSTPEIDFKPDEGLLKIEGESYPENSFEFYEPIFDWLEEYLDLLDEKKVKVEIYINYLNTSSTKSIMYILDLLDEAYTKGASIEMIWYYEEDNELSYEIAEDFMSYLELPFELIER